MSELTYARVEKALTYLAETDELEAQLRAELEASKKAREKIFTVIAASAKEGTVMQREALAYESSDYENAHDRYIEAIAKHAAIKNERDRNELVIQVWGLIPKEVRAAQFTEMRGKIV